MVEFELVTCFYVNNRSIYIYYKYQQWFFFVGYSSSAITFLAFLVPHCKRIYVFLSNPVTDLYVSISKLKSRPTKCLQQTS